MGAFEIIDRQAKGLFHGMPLVAVVLDMHGDDLGVASDIVEKADAAFFMVCLEFLVVVDVAVEADVNNARMGGYRRHGPVVQGMAVGLVDGAHRGPAGMRRNREKRRGREMTAANSRSPLICSRMERMLSPRDPISAATL